MQNRKSSSPKLMKFSNVSNYNTENKICKLVFGTGYDKRAEKICSVFNEVLTLEAFLKVKFPESPDEREIKVILQHAPLFKRTGFVKRFCPSSISGGGKFTEAAKSTRSKYVIDLQAWFFENYSDGYIIGMLCHELAVHVIGDYMVKDKLVVWKDDYLLVSHKFENGQKIVTADLKRNSESTYLSEKDREQTLIYWQKHLGKSSPYLIPKDDKLAVKATIDPAKTGSNQPAHAFACAPGFTRYEAYRDFVIEVADVIHTMGNKQNLLDYQQMIKDLFECYLMDVTSILVTKDTRMPWKADAKNGLKEIADIFNIRRIELKKILTNPNYPKLLDQYLPNEISSVGVLKKYGYMAYAASGTFGFGFSTKSEDSRLKKKE